MEQWLQFAQEQWYVLVLGIIAVFIIVKVVKALVKWLLIIGIVIGIAYYGIDYTDKIKEVGGQVMDYALEQAFDVMTGEAGHARYVANADGSYTITGDNISLSGKLDSDEVEIMFKGQTIKVKMNEVIRKFVQQAKENSE